MLCFGAQRTSTPAALPVPAAFRIKDSKLQVKLASYTQWQQDQEEKAAQQGSMPAGQVQATTRPGKGSSKVQKWSTKEHKDLQVPRPPSLLRAI